MIGIGTLLAWVGALAAVVAAGAFVLLVIRRRLISDQDPGPAVGLTLHDLREMRSRGMITDSEYERARSLIIGGADGQDAGPPAEPDPDEPRAR